MAAQTNRTVTLTLDAQTTGTDGIVNLAKELQKLGKQGGDAAPEFERLAAELQGIADQQATVNTMKALTDEVQKSVGVMTSAKEAVTKEEAALSALNTTLRAAKASEEAHAASVRAAVATRQQANQQYLEARAKISEYVASIGGAKRANDEQKVTLRELNQSLRESKAAFDNSKAAVAALTPEYDKLKSASAGIAAEVKQQEGALRSVAKVADSAKENYNDLTTALADTSQQADRLGINTTDLVGEQNRLKQSTLQLTQEADKLKVSLKSTGDVALTAAQRIAQAFSGTSVKSANALQNEILKIDQGLLRLAKDAKLTEYDFDSAFKAGKARIAELNAEMNKATQTTKSFGSSVSDAFKQFGPASAVFTVVSRGIEAITSAASRIPEVAADFQTLERSLRILTGSTAAARKEMAYISEVANKVGQDIKPTADAYVRLTAATKGTNLEGKQTKAVFEAVAGAMGAMGASSAKTELALQALAQMASKGVVSMEEMRQQLGEQLPQAFQATAAGLGITTSELNDLIASGQLTADEVFPALVSGLKTIYGEIGKNDSLRGQWAEFTNGLKQFADAIGQTGVIDLLLTIGRAITAGIVVPIQGVVYSAELFAAAMRVIRSGGKDLDKEMAQLAEKGRALDASFNALIGSSPEVSRSMQAIAVAAKKAGINFIDVGDNAKVAVDAIIDSSDGFIKFSVASSKAERSAERFATSARKSAEYTRASGEAAITAANALGNETDKRVVAIQVAKDNAAALGVLAGKEREVLAVLEARALRMAEDLRDGKLQSDAHRKLINELGEEISKQRTVADGTDRQTEANRLLAESLKLVDELMTTDNSENVAAYAQKNSELTDALVLTREAVDAGIMSQWRLNVLEEEASKVKARLSDALKDQIEKINALKDQKVAQLNLDASGLNLAIALQKSIQQTARLRGDEYGVMVSGNAIKRLEIQLMEITAKVKAAEARSIIEATKAKREELRLAGELTAAKEADLQTAELGAQAKIKESEIITETVKQLKELADVTEFSGQAAGSAAGGYEKLTGSLKNVGTAADDAAAAVAGLNGAEQAADDARTGRTSKMDSSSVLDDKAMKGRTAPVDVEALLYKRNPNASVDEVQAAAKYYGELYAREAATRLTGNLGNGDNAARLTNIAANQSADKALELARRELASGQAIDLGVSVNDLTKKNVSIMTGRQGSNATTTATAIQRAGAEAKRQGTENLATVNINLNGNRTQITASQDDAKKLTDLFKIIESDASRAF